MFHLLGRKKKMKEKGDKKVKCVSPAGVSKKFQCHECLYSTGDVCIFKKHRMCHEEEAQNKWKCGICSFSSNSKRNVNVHQALYHNVALVNNKSERASEKNTKSSMEESSNCSSSADTFTTDNVNATMMPLSGYLDPFTVQANGTLSCNECSYAAANERNMLKHCSHHELSGPAKCSFCSYSTCTNNRLLGHVYACHSESMMIAPRIDELKQRNILRLVKKTKKKRDRKYRFLSCCVCNAKFKSGKRLLAHCTSMHPYSNFFQCPECPQLLSSALNRRKHCRARHNLKFHNKSYDPDLDIIGLLKSSSNIIAGSNHAGSSCTSGAESSTEQCLMDVTSATSITLQHHETLDEQCNVVNVAEGSTNMTVDNVSPASRAASTDESILKYHCPCCDTCTKSRSALERHAALHRDAMLYLCLYCSFTTVWKYCMEAHMQRQHMAEIERGDGSLRRLVNMCYQPGVKQPELKGQRTANRSVTEEVPKRLSDASSEKESETSSQAQNDCCDTVGIANQVFNVEKEQDKRGGDENNVSVTVSDYVASSSVSVVNGHKQWSCLQCDFTTAHQSRMKTHTEAHENLCRYICSICGMRANTKCSIEVHSQRCHPDEEADIQRLPAKEAEETLGDYLASHNKKFRPASFGSALTQSPSDDSQFHNLATDKEKIVRQNKAWYKGCQLTSSTSIHRRMIGGSARVTYVNSKKKFSCRRCKYDTDTAENMYSHVINHIKLLRYGCPRCEYRGKEKEKVSRHLIGHHNDRHSKVVTLAEDIDTRLEQNSETLSPVPRSSSSRSSSTDEQCVSSKQIASLFRQVIKHGKRMFACRQCKFSSNKMWRIRDHFKIHDNPKRFLCRHCGHRSNYRWHIKAHITQSHTNLKSTDTIIELSKDEAEQQEALATTSSSHAKTEQSSPRESSRFELRNPVPATPPATAISLDASLPAANRCRQYRCSSCGFRANWPSQVREHRDLQHREAKVERMGHEEAQRTFNEYMIEHYQKYPKSFKAQNRVKTAENCFAAKVTSLASSKVKRLKCSECGWRCDMRYQIDRHIRMEHPAAKVLTMTIPRAAATLQEYLASKVGKSSAPSNSTQSSVDPSLISGEDSTNSVPPDNAPAVSHRYSCKHCSYQSNFFIKIMTHMNKEHPSNANNGDSSTSGHALQRSPRSDTKAAPFGVSADLENRHSMSSKDSIQKGIDQKFSLGRKNGTSVVMKRKATCDICPYSASSSVDLARHKTLHTERPGYSFRCSVCPYYVRSAKFIQIHMEVHYRHNEAQRPKKMDCKTQSLTKGQVMGDEEAKTFSDASRTSLILGAPMYDFDAVSDAVEISVYKQRLIARRGGGPGAVARSSDNSLVGETAVNSENDGQMRHSETNSQPIRRNHSQDSCTGSDTSSNAADVPRPLMRQVIDGNGEIKYYARKSAGSAKKSRLHARRSFTSFHPRPVGGSGASVVGSNTSLHGDVVATGEFSSTGGNDSGAASRDNARYGCEKCPYTTLKPLALKRHLVLHGSNQRYTCSYCDYSVPNSYYLLMHSRTHFAPNPNLLLTQSESNLELLPQVDVATSAAGGVVTNTTEAWGDVIVTQDHTNLFENTSEFVVPSRLFRCSRCPFSCDDRITFALHLRQHKTRLANGCPFCDYSAEQRADIATHVVLHINMPGGQHALRMGNVPRSTRVIIDNVRRMFVLNPPGIKEKMAAIIEPINGLMHSASELSVSPVTIAVHKASDHDSSCGTSRAETEANCVTGTENSALDLVRKDSEATLVIVSNEQRQKLESTSATVPMDIGHEVALNKDSRSKYEINEIRWPIANCATTNASQAKSCNSNESIPPALKTGLSVSATGPWICQFCGRSLPSGELLTKHEASHLYAHFYLVH